MVTSDIYTQWDREELSYMRPIFEIFESFVVLINRHVLIQQQVFVIFFSFRIFFLEELTLKVSDVFVNLFQHDSNLIFIFWKIVNEYCVIQFFVWSLLLLVLNFLSSAWCRNLAVLIIEFIARSERVIKVNSKFIILIFLIGLIILIIFFVFLTHCFSVSHVLGYHLFGLSLWCLFLWSLRSLCFLLVFRSQLSVVAATNRRWLWLSSFRIGIFFALELSSSELARCDLLNFLFIGLHFLYRFFFRFMRRLNLDSLDFFSCLLDLLFFTLGLLRLWIKRVDGCLSIL